jgi:hypothetical protein
MPIAKITSLPAVGMLLEYYCKTFNWHAGKKSFAALPTSAGPFQQHASTMSMTVAVFTSLSVSVSVFLFIYFIS